MAEQKGLKYDGICIKCGKPIKGFMNHPFEFDKGAQYSRKPRPNGLLKATWHKECEMLADNPETVVILLERQRKHFAIVSHGGYGHSAPITESITAPIPESISAPITESKDEEMNQEAMQAMIAAAVKAAMTGQPIPDAVKPAKTSATLKPVSIRSNWWEKLETVIACGMTRVLLVGPPGTGKSTTADRDNLRVTCHEDAGPESMIGTFIQKDGNTIWIDGPSVQAMKKGSRIVKDELDHTSPECISLLYALLDDSPSIMLPTGEYVQAAKGYQVVCTSNANPADLPDAILDRIEAVIVADIPHTNAVNTIKAGAQSDSLVALMSNYYRGLSKDTFNWKGQPTLRRVRNFGKLLTAGMDKDVAAQAVFGNAYKEILSALTTAAVR